MFKLKIVLLALLTFFLNGLISNVFFIAPAPALIETKQAPPETEVNFTRFEWTGAAGYSLKGVFGYSDTYLNHFTEKGTGQTNYLNFLTVTIFDPVHHPIDTYKNVVNGQSSNHYFKFNFNPIRQEIFGEIDFGGEASEEIYLKGKINQNLSLIKIDSEGNEYIIDQNDGLIVVHN